MIRRASVAVLVAAVLAGCPLHPHAPVPQTTEGEWGAVRDAASRREFLYDRLQHRATATATHLSLAVREARARRLATWLQWTPAQLEERLAQERAAAASSEQFLLSFFAADPIANDLDAPRSSWTIVVKVDGAELRPTRVTATDMDVTLLGLFPFVGPFDTAYVVTCPRLASGDLAGRPFQLDLSSALGRMTLDWGQPPVKSINQPVNVIP